MKKIILVLFTVVFIILVPLMLGKIVYFLSIYLGDNPSKENIYFYGLFIMFLSGLYLISFKEMLNIEIEV